MQYCAWSEDSPVPVAAALYGKGMGGVVETPIACHSSLA